MENFSPNFVNGVANDHRLNDYRENQNPRQVLMFPWLAHGHISPFLKLAKKLAYSEQFVVHLCSTLVNLNSVRKKLDGDENFSSSIKFVEHHLEESSVLPASFHTTNGLPLHLMNNLKKAYENSKDNFNNILISLKPDLLIYDSIQPWAAVAAKENNIPAVDFITSSTVMTSFCYHLFKNPQGKSNDFPFIDIIHYRPYEKHFLDNLIASAENQHIKKESSIECINMSSDIVLIKGINEVEGKYCDYLSEMCGKRIILVGPLVQEPNQDDENFDIIKWLDTKSEKSTIFISLGSEYFLSDEERKEVALGLELSNVNFVWVVRFPKEQCIMLQDSLPEGFLSRVGNRGLVVEGWAPQTKILEHPSIGGFVSHCGWSSIMESINYGVPIIAMPIHIDQPINARLVEEVGVGIEIIRNYNGKFMKETIAQVIDQVVIKEEGRFVREKAKNMSAKIALNGDQEIDVAIKELAKL